MDDKEVKAERKEEKIKERTPIKKIVGNWFKEDTVKKKIRKIIAREGLIIIALAILGIIVGLINYFVTDGRVAPLLSATNVSLILYIIHWIVRFAMWAFRILREK